MARPNEKRAQQVIKGGSSHGQDRQKKELVETPAEKHAYKVFQDTYRTHIAKPPMRRHINLLSMHLIHVLKVSGGEYIWTWLIKRDV